MYPVSVIQLMKQTRACVAKHLGEDGGFPVYTRKERSGLACTYQTLSSTHLLKLFKPQMLPSQLGILAAPAGTPSHFTLFF